MTKQTPSSREQREAHIIKYIDTDLLCYRTDSPKHIAELQQEKWQPWLGWFAQTYGYELKTTTGINALEQSDAIKKILHSELKTLSNKKFEALYGATTVCGSCVLGLAIMAGALKPQEALNLIFLEENYKGTLYDSGKYGVDPITEKKQKEALESLDHAAALLRESIKNASASSA